MYYSYNQISTYRQPIKAICGGEGIGKTYGLKIKLIEELLESAEPFEVAWFIRYDVDISPKYIAKWQDDLPIDYKQRITVDGQCLRFDGQPFVWFLALSKFISGKGIPYPLVKHAVLDEFILDKDSRYLTNEIFAFKRWTQSLFRLRQVSWWLLANALTFDNPYFNYFKVCKSQNSEWFSSSKIVVHFPKSNKEFKKKAKQADYYKIFDDEETERYGLEGEFYFDNNEFISSKPKSAKPLFNIKIKRNIYTIWESNTILWVSADNIKSLKTYAVTRSDTGQGIPYIAVVGQTLKDLYTSNHLWFAGLTLKNNVLEVIQCL